ncbi:MAG: hypothetical protein FJ137_02495 [Deltaproteobacteria bacterium]|nr:hypothetical protein [Deltaproteobacteria bacterium]
MKPSSARAVDFRRVERAALLLHFDGGWATRILDGDVLGLTGAEKAMLRAVDRRAFRADPERAARAAAVIVAELPVAIAVAGVPRLLSFFRADAFVDVIVGRAPLVVGAADFLDSAPARIEGAVGRARRRRHVDVGDIVVAPHVAAALVPDGALAQWTAARQSLGDDAVAAIGAGRRIAWPAFDDAEAAGVLVTGDAANPAVGPCTAALARLLHRLEDGVDLAAFRAVACAEGCDDDAEADALLADLVADGLLRRG